MFCSVAMYRYRYNDVPIWYFTCTEVVLQKTRTEIDLICTEVVMYRNCPPLCTETVMYRKRPNPLKPPITGVKSRFRQARFQHKA